ncbi:MAG: hypothetical protein HY051_02970 [Candidatus Aenigmarchaeota archaeon]|nr:hypothetical protein [Candidatus Aenigmarchaeota archaeon]
MRKEDLVNELNDLLEMEHPISVWQCLQIRKYELEEIVSKVRLLHDSSRGYSRSAGIDTPVDDQAYRQPRALTQVQYNAAPTPYRRRPKGGDGL